MGRVRAKIGKGNINFSHPFYGVSGKWASIEERELGSIGKKCLEPKIRVNLPLN